MGKVTALRPKQSARPERPTTDTAAQEEQPAAEPMTLQVVLVFHVDGAPVLRVPFVGQVPRPAADQAGQLQLTLDGRVLAQMLEPHLGPSAASAVKPKLWTPGA